MGTVKVERNTYTVESLYQWDKNQELVIFGLSLASIPEVHFTNAAMGKAIVRQASVDANGVIRANIPNSLLQQPLNIQVYVCTYEGNTFETQYKLDIPVKARNKPEDYILENDPEVYSFNALENQLANAIVQLAAAEDALASAEDALAAAEEAFSNPPAAPTQSTVRVIPITLVANSWTDKGSGLYTQDVIIEGGTTATLVDLLPTNEQMLSLIGGGVSFLKVDNDNGVFAAAVGGAVPSADMVVQASLTEVIV